MTTLETKEDWNHGGKMNQNNQAEISRRESLEKIKIIVPGMRAKIIDILQTMGPKTAWEIASITGWMIHSVRPRLNELYKSGQVVVSGLKLNRKTNTNCLVYELSKFDQIGPVYTPKVDWKKRALTAEAELQSLREDIRNVRI